MCHVVDVIWQRAGGRNRLWFCRYCADWTVRLELLTNKFLKRNKTAISFRSVSLQASARAWIIGGGSRSGWESGQHCSQRKGVFPQAPAALAASPALWRRGKACVKGLRGRSRSASTYVSETERERICHDMTQQERISIITLSAELVEVCACDEITWDIFSSWDE